MGIRTWFRGVVARVRAKLAELPTLEEAWSQRRVIAAALRKLGDRVAALEPEQIAELEWVARAAQLAQIASERKLGNAEKREQVLAAVRMAWTAAGIADRVFDSWWAEWGDPFLAQFCDEAKGHGLAGWEP